MAAIAQNVSRAIADTWNAELALHFERSATRTVLAKRRHLGPLVVQRPFYPEDDVCHVYLVHPPGGIAGGDRIHLNAQLAASSHAVITTPAATKFYRTLPGRHSELRQEFDVADAILEWLPQENILFRETRTHMATIVRLTKQSRFIGWELTCYGRPASNERFDCGTARQHFEVWLNGRPTLLDHLRIDGAQETMQASWGLAGNQALGTLLAYPATEADLDAARAHEDFACTLVDGVLSCRALGNEGCDVKSRFVDLWQTLRPRIVGREAVTPRIWAT